MAATIGFDEDDGGCPMGFLDGIPLGPVLNGSGWAVAFGVVWYVARLVFLGSLVPRRTHEDTVAALSLERERNKILMEQLGKMTDSMETFEQFIHALPQPTRTAPHPPPAPPVRGQRGGGR